MTPESRPITSDGASTSVAVAELADELGTYRATIFKIARRLDVQTVKQRDSSRGNQLISVVSETGAAAIRAAYTEGTRGADQGASDIRDLAPDEGMFYLIQLEPKCDPGRFKVGFTTDLAGRLRHHRCSAPFAEYLRTWHCRRTWERAAIDCVTTDLEQLHTEVFRGSSLDEVADRGDRFFALMPTVGSIPDTDDEEIQSEEEAG